MSILIKGMEMPKSCRDCPLFESKYHFHGCLAKDESINNAKMWNEPLRQRPSWCPLVEIPPHGRLIDADVLTTVTEMVNGEWKTYLEVFEVDAAPTIIEAEGEDDSN